MRKIIIADTSCLILLEKIGALDLLHLLFGDVHVTPIIAAEFGSTLPSWFTVAEPVNLAYQAELQKLVDMGEASALALAAENKDSLLIMDDRKGRTLAKRLGLELTGTIGIIIDAKLRGLIPSVKPLIELIRKTNFHISSELERIMVLRAGENN